MVTRIAIDPMHTLYIGVLKHLMNKLMKNNLGQRYTQIKDKPTGQQILDSRIAACHAFLPDEFSRRVTSTSNIATWKAMEFRQFFLYMAFALMEDLIDAEPDVDEGNSGLEINPKNLVSYIAYFMYLLCGEEAVPISEDDLLTAEEVVENFAIMWMAYSAGSGSKPVVHMLLHLPQECREHGCRADYFSVAKYENSIRQLKCRVRSGFGKLQQVRTVEFEREKYLLQRDDHGLILKSAAGAPLYGWDFGKGSENDSVEYPEVRYVNVKKNVKKVVAKFGTFLVANDVRNAHVLISYNIMGNNVTKSKPRIFRIVNIQRTVGTNEYRVIGHFFKNQRDLFTEPLPSSYQGVYAFSNEDEVLLSFPVSCITSKLYVVPRFSYFGLSVLERGFFQDEGNYRNVKEWVGTSMQHVIRG